MLESPKVHRRVLRLARDFLQKQLQFLERVIRRGYLKFYGRHPEFNRIEHPANLLALDKCLLRTVQTNEMHIPMEIRERPLGFV